jgi:4'-phosphopantetheinyl transferase
MGLDRRLPHDELHVWSASLDRPAGVVARLHELLAADEQERAARFRFDRDRARYIVGRGVLRSLLGGYLAIEPTAVALRYGHHDKPMLAGDELWFNVSHSGAMALFAFSAAAELGIDIELEDGSSYARERIAERFFSPSEVADLRGLPEELRERAFLTCWTRKEAFIKARGDGLSLPLDSFDVTLKPGLEAALLRTEWSDDEPGHWRLRDLSDPERGYVAALAIRGQGWRMIERRLPGSFDENLEIEQEEEP